MRRILLTLACLLGMGGVLSASPLFAQANPLANVPFIAYTDTSELPDAQEVDSFYGTVTVTYRVDGTVVSEEGRVSTDAHLVEKLVTRIDKGKGKSTWSTTGTVVRTVHETKDGKPCDHIITATLSGQDTDTAENPANLVVSKKVGVARFSVGQLQLRSVTAATSEAGCNTEGAKRGTARFSDGGDNAPQDGQFPAWVLQAFRYIVRVPDYGAGNTAFSKSARGAEMAGQDAMDALRGPTSGLIEAPWTGASSHGEYTVKTLDGDTLAVRAALRARGENVEKDAEAYPGTISVSWNWNGKPPVAEMVLAPKAPQEYDAWRPLPADDRDRVYGQWTPVEFTARIQPKSNAPKGSPTPSGQIDFYLRDVSRHKGQCTNYPKDGAEKDDLRFSKTQPDGLTWVDEKHVRTTGKVTEASVLVEAMDTGAYGKIQATCDDLGLIAKNTRTDEETVSIPRDDNNNHVADNWERERGIFEANYPATWDEDPKPSGQRRKGDGYTLYEEYRGFIHLAGKGDQAHKEFVRTDPLTKDLFVWDRDNLISSYYEGPGGSNPANVNLHYLYESMLQFNGNKSDQNNRWVNFNSDQGKDWYARQYALYAIVDETIPDVGGGGAEFECPRSESVFDQPLRKCWVMRLALVKLASQFASFPDKTRVPSVLADRAITVVHEVGHALGIHHHFPTGTQVFVQDGKAKSPETDASITDGVLTCPMRYYNDDETKHAVDTGVAVRRDYCRAGQSYKGADGAMHPGDNCYGQIDVKSDP